MPHQNTLTEPLTQQIGTSTVTLTAAILIMKNFATNLSWGMPPYGDKNGILKQEWHPGLLWFYLFQHFITVPT